MNTMKKIVAFAMIVSMVLGCFIISTSAAEKQEYVKDGLVAWYDASNNNNGTHDPMSDLWKDLSGNANHIDISAAVSKNEISWTDNALVINGETGTYLRLPNKVIEALEGQAYTIEIVTGELNYTATAYITLLNSSNDELSVFIRCGGEHAPGQPNQLKLEYKNQDANGDSNRPYMYDAWNYFNGKTLAVTSDLDAFDGTRDMAENPNQAGNVFMYSDGIQLAKGESEYNMDLGGYLYFGHTAENRRWGGEIYGLRIYNRALTADEIADNAAADKFNYRNGTTFEPTQEYDPALDEGYEGFVKLEGYVNNRIVFNQATDLIPLTGFYASQNLFDYLYPFESDEVQWEGARLMKTEEPETDYDGTPYSGVNFDILYQNFCTRASMSPVRGIECQYIVLKLVVNGEFEDFNMNVIGYQAATDSDIEFSTSSLYGGIDYDKEGEVQYLIYDVEGIFDDCDFIAKMGMTVNGLADDAEIYLQEIAFCASESEAYIYAGEEVPETEAPDTDAPAGDETQAPAGDETQAPAGNETQAPAGDKDETKAPADDKDETKAPAGTNNDETKAPENKGGCKSVVGFGAAAILVAAAAAVVLKKKD
jgi:hypothetical protein